MAKWIWNAMWDNMEEAPEVTSWEIIGKMQKMRIPYTHNEWVENVPYLHHTEYVAIIETPNLYFRWKNGLLVECLKREN